VIVAMAFVGSIAIALTNPITALWAATALALAAATRASYSWWAAIVAGLAAATWAVGPARDALHGSLAGLFEHRGATLEVSAATAVGEAVDRWNIVLIAGRLGLQLLVVLAVAGFVQRFRDDRPITTLVALAATPFLVALLAAPSIEHVLQAMFLALPWVAIAAGFGLGPVLRTRDEGGDVLRTAGRLLFVVVLAATALIATSGQEHARDLGGVLTVDTLDPETGGDE
jgi:hypothetical protein